MGNTVNTLRAVSGFRATAGNTTGLLKLYSPAIQRSVGIVHGWVSTDKEDVPVLLNEEYQDKNEYNMTSYLFRKLHVCT